MPRGLTYGATTAHWTENSCTVFMLTFDSDGGSSSCIAKILMDDWSNAYDAWNCEQGSSILQLLKSTETALLRLGFPAVATWKVRMFYSVAEISSRQHARSGFTRFRRWNVVNHCHIVSGSVHVTQLVHPLPPSKSLTGTSGMPCVFALRIVLYNLAVF